LKKLVPDNVLFCASEYEKQAKKNCTSKNGNRIRLFGGKIKSLKNAIKEIEAKPIAFQYNGEDAIQIVMHDISAKIIIKEQARAQIAEETNELLEQEITKRKVIQLQLLESQKYTRLIINGSIDMICASDRKGFITEFNEAAQKTFGYTTDECL